MGSRPRRFAELVRARSPPRHDRGAHERRARTRAARRSAALVRRLDGENQNEMAAR